MVNSHKSFRIAILSKTSKKTRKNERGNDKTSKVKDVAEKILPIDIKSLCKLGIDEISLVKGQGKLIVVLVDLETHKLVGLVSERTQSEIEKVMKRWGEKVLSQIKEVSIATITIARPR